MSKITSRPFDQVRALDECWKGTRAFKMLERTHFFSLLKTYISIKQKYTFVCYHSFE